MDKKTAKQNLKVIIEKYNKFKQEKDFMKNERQACDSLIRPFFRDVLGWDVDNPYEFKSEYQEGGKRVDYVACIDDITQFTIEAKAPSVDIIDNSGFYKQAVNYAEYKEKDFAILTNFNTFIIFRAGIQTKNFFMNEIKRIDISKMSDEDFDYLWYFSRDFWIESADSNPIYALKNLKKKRKIDENLVEDMAGWREALLKSLRKNTTKKFNFDTEDGLIKIEEEIQRFIDRLVFVCYCEDKKLNDTRLNPILREKGLKYPLKDFLLPKIRELFREYKDKYNSDLFEFGLCDEFDFEEWSLKRVLEELRTPINDLPYDFSAIEADILGRAYEKFLGHTITGKKNFKEREDIGKRKKEGIYYTPQYIVNYIIKNTLKAKIKNKSFEEILKVRILDPACGSGSFLIKVFDVLVEESKLKLKRDLTYEEKKKLMVNCIYGVDKDERACDIAKLNLSLKLATRGEKLPELHDNIKNGNSLIDDSKTDAVHFFKWEEKFKEIIKEGGFDIILGNPPYIRIQTLDEDSVNFFNSHYKSATKNYDIYALFVEKGLSLLKKDGLLGFILPSKFFNADYGEGLRKIISDKKSLYQIVNFKDFQVFDGATTYTCLLFLKNSDNKEFTYLEIADKEKLEQIKTFLPEFFKVSKQKQISGDATWNFVSDDSKELMNSLDKIKLKLGDISKNLFQGLVTGADKLYFVYLTQDKGKYVKVKNKYDGKDYIIEKEIVKKLLKGKEIRKWFIDWQGIYVVYPYSVKSNEARLIPLEEIKERYPKSYEYFTSYEKELKAREKGRLKGSKDWHQFGRLQNIDKFEQPKIITQVLSSKNSFTFDAKGEYYFVGGGNAGGYGIALKKEYLQDYYWVLSLLNSKVLEFYLKKISTPFRGGFYSYGKRFIEKLPIIIPSEQIKKELSDLSKRQLENIEKIKTSTDSPSKLKDMNKESADIDEEINNLVYSLYGITDKEREIIEESLK
jgi:predicted type IV restriction endonuclease/methylase of polypeptide subunit release factors